MSNMASWYSPAILSALGWTLIAFLWEGLALAAMFAALAALCRSASARYLLGVATLVAMLAAPAITYLRIAPAAGARLAPAAAAAVSAPSQPSLAAPRAVAAPLAPAPAPRSGALLWLVEVWLAGVGLLSLRAAGGFLALERLGRRAALPVSLPLLEKCLALQRRLRLGRRIGYRLCRELDAPAVLGWFRPLVLLPITALTGLSEAQLEAVIAHELAHIRRSDAFVNLLQVAAETLLFYHPAVWWVSRRTRAERENCCDDAAIRASGDAVAYARALALMAEWRSAPSFALAANRGPLAARVRRLLGLGRLSWRARGAGIVASVFCLVGALLAGNAWFGVARQSFATSQAPRAAASAAATAFPSQPAPPAATTQQARKPATTAPSAAPARGGSYIEGMKAAGLPDLTVEQLIALKVQGVTPEYVQAIHGLGLEPSVGELIGMKVQGVSPEYIRALRVAGITANVGQLIGMRVQGISPDYVRQMRALGLGAGVGELIGMKVQGVTPGYVAALQKTGIAEFRDQPRSYIAARVNGLTPEFIQTVQSHGLKNLDLEKLIALKRAGIF